MLVVGPTQRSPRRVLKETAAVAPTRASLAVDAPEQILGQRDQDLRHGTEYIQCISHKVTGTRLRRPTAHQRSELGLLANVASRSYLDREMRAVGLKTLKNRLSEYVRLVASGETVLVTDRERVVAELVPPQHGRGALASDALLVEAVRSGWLTPALGAAGEAVPRRPVAKLGRLLAELERDRADR